LASHNEAPILNAPPAVRWIVGITVAVHVLRLLLPIPVDDWVLETFGFFPGRYHAPVANGEELFAMLVSPITHLFLHADWMHLIMNMAFFLAFGSAVGRRMGSAQMLVLYFLCGIAAAFFWASLYAPQEALLFGASGAVSGMVGAAARVSIWPSRHASSAIPFWRRSTIITFVVVWLLLNVVFGIFPELISTSYAGIAWEAHLGGFIAGFVLIGAFDGRGRLEAVAMPAGLQGGYRNMAQNHSTATAARPMDALESLLTRCSVPARMLREPAPDGIELQTILESAMRAPDHASLRPWRFLIIRGDARRELGEVFADALCRRDPLADGAAREKEVSRPMRSPLIVAVCADIVENNPKVPVVEQVVACAAAAQNMLNAAHAMGYAGIMLTGKNAHDPYVKQALGLKPKDEIVGFLYFGTPDGEARPKKRPSAAEFVREWTGRSQA
jgi:membrane associated rhomboid family serine protease/nitroreductase